MSRITVIGGGSWGTALAVIAARGGHDVTLWSRDAEVVGAINAEQRNPKYLSDVAIPLSVHASLNLSSAVYQAQSIILAAPSHGIRELMEQIAGEVTPDVIFVSAAKGIETTTGLRVSEITEEVLKGRFVPRFVCLSGPSFAREAAMGHPTAVAAASRDISCARVIQGELSSPTFRVYANTDLVGTEICGAVKNVMAIAAGMVSGLGYGSNSLAALITRGIAEMGRLAIYFGARRETMTGLAGLGDLVLTCTGSLSRNRFVGEELGKGRQLDSILAGMREVAEGVKTTMAVRNRAIRAGIEMPITEAVYAVLYEQETPLSAIEKLMTRPLKDEF
jgi:glycerol-3-phosphate dehydrogenase (NAD(P)+)